MLFDEFVQGTGCKETDYNYKIYKRLELMYMADESITKEEIYEYGRKLVDNSKTEAELVYEQKLKQEVIELRQHIDFLKSEVERYKSYAKDETDPFWVKHYKGQAKVLTQQIAHYRTVIRFNKLQLKNI